MQFDTKRMKRDSDSFLTAIFARSISVHLTPIIAKRSITPLQVTILGLCFGIIASWQATKHLWLNQIVAAILIELSHISDCVDGELARVTGRGNLFAAALDPITDRVKDIFIIFAAFIQSMNSHIFGWSPNVIFAVSFFTVSLWIFYMYIVDAHLNPSRAKRGYVTPRIYLGLYDLFVYGSIGFLIVGFFEYFCLFVVLLAVAGCSVQLVRLKKTLQ
jgi:phosphatidylglycerophosphate synthase